MPLGLGRIRRFLKTPVIRGAWLWIRCRPEVGFPRQRAVRLAALRTSRGNAAQRPRNLLPWDRDGVRVQEARPTGAA